MEIPTEAIWMRQRKFKYFPQLFTWHGHNYRVEAVERTWSTQRGDQIQRHYFKCRCAEGTFTVFQDVKSNTWQVEVK